MASDQEERVARNDSVFREANERLAAFAESERKEDPVGMLYLCECANPRCTKLLRLSLDDYRRVRSSPRRFVVAANHLDGEVEVVERHEGWSIVEKQGATGEVAEELA